MELILKRIKKRHYPCVQWRQTLVNIIFWKGLVPKIERECVAVATQRVTLEPVPLLLVGDPKLVDVVTLKFEGLLINRDLHTTFPCGLAHTLNVFKPGLYLPVWVLLPVRLWQGWVLHAEKATEVFVPPCCICS